MNYNGHGDGWIVAQGTDFTTFSDCCPWNHNDTQYIMQRDCRALFCYTSDIQVAGAFDKCVSDTAKLAIEKAKKAGNLNGDNTTWDMYYTMCEYIDYELLSKGIVVRSGASREKAWSLKVLVSAMGLGLFVIGSIAI